MRFLTVLIFVSLSNLNYIHIISEHDLLTAKKSKLLKI